MKIFFLTLLFLATLAHNRVLLKDINSLVLRPGHQTTGRRTSPIPQLECVGGTARLESHKVGTVVCTNMGFNGNSFNWKCDSQLPSTLKLGTHIDVNCEGYDYPGDPYILEGSCSLKYSLDHTELNFPVVAPNKVLLAEIKSLVFHPGQQTKARRTSPIPQLECVGGTARPESHRIGTVLCTNMGFNGNSFNWKCDAQLPPTLKLGTHIDVNCEGYDYPGDSYVLEGSCGLRYSLEYTNYHSSSTVTETETITTTHFPTLQKSDPIGYVISAFIVTFLIFAAATVAPCCVLCFPNIAVVILGIVIGYIFLSAI